MFFCQKNMINFEWEKLSPLEKKLPAELGEKKGSESFLTT